MLRPITSLNIFKKIASKNVKSELKTIDDFIGYVERWYRKKYNLAATDPRFLDSYTEDIIIEFFESYFDNNPKELEAYEKGFETAADMDEAEVREIMGDQYTGEIAFLEDPTLKIEKEEIVDNFEDNYGK